MSAQAMDLDRNALNFSGGPGALPQSVLLQVQQAILAIPEVGLSILGISHRSSWFESVIHEATQNIRTLLAVPDDYRILFLQGGATQQFATIAMGLLNRGGKPADYLCTGYWSSKAIDAARHAGNIRLAWSGEASQYSRLPTPEELELAADAPFFHYISNETVEGLQFTDIPGRDDVLRICDMSSDFLSKPIDVGRHDLIYAHAQKNIGPAGITIVIIHNSLAEQMGDRLPAFLDYRSHIKANSIFNTPPVFAIYVVLLITRWLRNDIGGLTNMHALNQAKADCIYTAIDQNPQLYRGHSQLRDRSLMNATFHLPDSRLEQHFLTSAEGHGMSGLAGHRAAGGIRASLYNGLTLAAAQTLAAFMTDFARQY